MSTFDADLCPRFHQAVEIIGRRWSGSVLRLLLDGATRFHEFSDTIPGISDKMLSERLKELEAGGLITRSVEPTTPVRVEYHLTAMGEALRPIMDSVSEWANTWIEEPAAETG